MDEDWRQVRGRGHRWGRHGRGWEDEPPEGYGPGRGDPRRRLDRAESWAADEGRVSFRHRGEHYGRGPRGWSRSDDRIREEICEDMARHGHLDASHLQVEVRDGEVTLEGEVPNRLQKRLAERIADEVLGVVDVHNRLSIRRTPPRSEHV